MSDHPHVLLGNAGEGKHKHSLPCYPQPWPRVVKRIGRAFDSFEGTDGELDTAALVQSLQISDKLYDLFECFIPNITDWLPEHEFNGYTSPEAWKQGRYDEDNDPAPTFPQFLDAVDVIIEVNGGKRFLDMLGKVFPLTWIQAKIAEAVEDWQETRRDRSIGSPSSPGTSGESRPSGSTTIARTEAQPSTESEIESLDFVPRSEWMPSSGEPLTTSA